MKIDWDDGSVTAAWDGSPDDADRVLVLAHGAGGDMTDAILTGVANELAADGTAVLRFNFPYREAGRRRARRADAIGSVLPRRRGRRTQERCAALSSAASRTGAGWRRTSSRTATPPMVSCS